MVNTHTRTINCTPYLETARVVPVGPHTKFPGNADETWVSGYGVQLIVRVGDYTGTAIVPFMDLAQAEEFLQEIIEDNKCLT